MNGCWPTQVEIVGFVAMDSNGTSPNWYPFMAELMLSHEKSKFSTAMFDCRTSDSFDRISNHLVYGRQHNANDNLTFKLRLLRFATNIHTILLSWLSSLSMAKIPKTALFCLGPEQVPSLCHDPAALPAPARPWNCPQAGQGGRPLPTVSWHQP